MTSALEIATETHSASLKRAQAVGVSPYAVADRMLSVSLTMARTIHPDLKLADLSEGVGQARRAQRTSVQSPYHRVFEADRFRREHESEIDHITSDVLTRGINRSALNAVDRAEFAGALLQRCIVAIGDIPGDDPQASLEHAWATSELKLQGERKRVEKKQKRQHSLEEWSGSRT